MAGELFGLDFSSAFNAPAVLLLLIGISGILAVIGSFFYMNVNKKHPKVNFLLLSKMGIITRGVRLFSGKTVSTVTAWELLLGKIPSGFRISDFTYEYVGTKKTYVGYWIDGRILPTTMNFGNTQFTLIKCPKCGKSDALDTSWMKDKGGILFCSDCDCPLKEEGILLDNVLLHALKFDPSLETRFIYFSEKIGDSIKKIPIQEWVSIYDIAARIGDIFTHEIRNVDNYVEKQNPLLTILMATVPYAIITLTMAVAIYVMWLGVNGQITQSAQLLLEAAKELAKAKGVS
ncbi:Uncharacterised protein [Candidatus Anstonella stagnisolia]|nr:Uncharacterised protein [Candidatus Anstonella stagnisolia]